MKLLLRFSAILVAAGCFSQAQPARTDSPNKPIPTTAVSYRVLTDTPVEILDELASNYTGDLEQWREGWIQSNFTTTLDGQSTIRLLEIACYADVMCHTIEYPLRVVTHDFIRERMDMPEVRSSLEWIRSSYHSGLPLKEPGDTTGDFDGMLVESMNFRMREYANQLLKSSDSTSVK
ncbi:hypothetical protein [Rubinisphaera sp.]|uniref:hypothetical protein n=1 Tax=Rubinisphaera sp. TaxID=2024857 RepID=UPI000C0F6C3A|nr:hypothetical protein [Rubinisphaera sp.]MBV09497.1 hypothetical protein [Rubinisphaera sp.]HCS53515.1 hypothetical protein [Planctomycetaceae bacterium]|tara:strand:+ start:8505 stop:9035 length:531 start_codon:yes stop_codon:yes gene_type:complete